jgi:5-oxoprolinase (ATP-hydrolysing) subunit A
MHIDLNADLGEGCGHDAELMPLVTSANVACGFHAGDAATALVTLQLAAKHRVRVGAHPGFADREHFGRRELVRSEQQIFEDCVYQIGAISGLARAAGLSLSYFKAHGALYNMACRDDACARPLVRAAELFALPLLGLPGSRLQALCQGRCRFVAEGFADRTYRPDGSLTPRSEPNAFVESAEAAVQQALWLIREQKIETLCVHGDNPKALEFVRELRRQLQLHGLEVRAFA